LPDRPLVLGQDRAVASIQFGIGMRRHGYNPFALGSTGAGRHAIVRRFLEEQAASEPVARDWCYIHNFEQPHRPRAISLPKEMGVKCRNGSPSVTFSRTSAHSRSVRVAHRLSSSPQKSASFRTSAMWAGWSASA
jgi:hypothetical protein